MSIEQINIGRKNKAKNEKKEMKKYEKYDLSGNKSL
tara:strand:- start:221 stop:328 length:108 start_codon:yes stop_codon:yes gene_type:complete